MSTFWSELFQLHNIKLLTSIAYHPQTDGQSECVNQCLEMYLPYSVQEAPRKWKSWLPLAELWYNSFFHLSIGCSPFKALYGYEANFSAAPVLAQASQQTVIGTLKKRVAYLTLLKQRLAATQNRMKTQADKKRTDRQFQVGEQVLLKFQPYAQTSVVN